MSSGERNLKEAEKSLRELLEAKASAAAHRRNLIGPKEVVRFPSFPPPNPAPADFVLEKFRAIPEKAYQDLADAAKRGENAITQEDLEHALKQHALKQIESKPTEPESPLFEQAFDKFLEVKDVKQSTLNDYQDTGRLFRRFLERTHVHEISGIDIQNFVQSLKKAGKSQRTRQKHFDCLRSFFRWARDVAKFIKEDPTAGIRVRVQNSRRRKKRTGLTIDEAQKLLTACRRKRKNTKHNIQHVWLAVFIALRTELRARTNQRAG